MCSLRLLHRSGRRRSSFGCRWRPRRPASRSRSRASPPTADRAGALRHPLDRRLDGDRSARRPRPSSPGSRRPQRDKTLFAVDDDEWRKWMNQSFYVRQGVSFLEMTDAAAGRGIRPAARGAQRQGPEADARHHAPQRDARRADRQQLRRVRRVAVPHHGHGHSRRPPSRGAGSSTATTRSSTTSCSAIRW